MELIFSISDESKDMNIGFDSWVNNLSNTDSKYNNYIAMMRIARENTVFDPYMNQSSINVYINNTICYSIFKNTDIDLKTVLEELKPSIQAEIDKMGQ